MSNASSKTVKPAQPAVKKWPCHPSVPVIVAIGLFVVSQLVAGLIVLLLVTVTGGHDAKLFGSSVLFQFLFLLFAEGFVLAGVLGFLRWGGLGPRAIGLVRPKWMDITYAVAAYIVYATVYAVLVLILAQFIPSLHVTQKQDLGFDDAAGIIPLILVFFALVVLAPIAEEVAMRGLLFTSLRLRLPFWLSAGVTSIVFASLHLWGGQAGAGLLWIAGIDTFILSLTLCYLREKTGRLTAGIILHGIKNCIAFTALFILHMS